MAVSARPLAIALVTVSLLVVAGCVTVQNDDGDTDPQAIVENVNETLEETEAFEGRLVQTQRIGDNETMRMEAIVAYEAPGKINITYVSPERFAGTRIVSNGSDTMIYNPNTGTATVQAINSTAGANASSTGLFFGASSIGSNATFEGNETVGDDDTVSLSYSASGREFSVFLGGAPERRSRLANRSNPVETTVWIDQETWFPTKARLNYTNLQVPMVQTIRYRNFTRLRDLPDDRFSVEPPSTATRSEGLMTPFMDENMTSYLSRSAMTEDVDEPVPDPAVPERFEFKRGMSMGNGTLLWTIYEGGGDIVQVQRIPEPVSVYKSDRSVAVGDQTAVFTRAQGQLIVEWQCGDATYVVYGTASAFEPEELAAIGESIECG